MDKNAPICFVITGFGTKTDYETGKSFNLDPAFKKLIQTVMMCVRTIELHYSGSIGLAGAIQKRLFLNKPVTRTQKRPPPNSCLEKNHYNRTMINLEDLGKKFNKQAFEEQLKLKSMK